MNREYQITGKMDVKISGEDTYKAQLEVVKQKAEELGKAVQRLGEIELSFQSKIEIDS